MARFDSIAQKWNYFFGLSRNLCICVLIVAPTARVGLTAQFATEVVN